MKEPTRPQEVGTILRIAHLLGGKASFSEIANPQNLYETKYSADLIRRALDALSGGGEGGEYLHLLDRLEAERGRGRPRIPYRIRYDAFYSIAITIQRRFFIAYIADLAGEPVGNLVIERSWRDPNLQDLYDGLNEIFRLYKTLPEQRPLLSIAVTAPGPLDVERGIIQSRQMGELRGYNLRDDLSEKFQIKSLFCEDSQAFALAELYANPSRDLSLIAITLGEGFGYAICHRGRLLGGSRASPWQSSSHFILPIQPALFCEDCHRAGCVRAYLGQSGRQRLQTSPEWSGDSLAAQRLVNDALAHIIAIQVITLDPLRVVLDIGTQYMTSPDEAPIYNPSFLISRIRELVSVPGRPIPVVELSKLEPSPRARGAGILPLHYLFHHPNVDYWLQLSPALRRQAL